MKIIHLTYADSGGAHNAVHRIHQALQKKNIDSKLWVNRSSLNDSTVKPVNRINKLVNDFRRHLIKSSLVKTLKTKNKIIHSPSILPSRWVKQINVSDADIIHLHWVQDEMLSIKDISMIKKPIVWTLHDMWAFCGAEHYANNSRWREGYNSNNRPNYESGFDLNLWTWQRKKKYWKKPIRIVTPSRWLANCVSESKLMSNWPVQTIPNPIDTDIWKPMDKKFAREEFNFPLDVSLILFGAMGGGKDPRKGFDLLLKSLKNLKNVLKTKKLELVVFGQNKIKSQIDIGFPIHYIGHLQNNLRLKAAYNAANVMIVPSRQDNLPSTAIEAQACGTPVVSFNVGGLTDIIIHQKTGYLAKKFDTNDLANGIRWVLDKQEDSKKLNYNSRERAIEKFSETKISDDYLNIYKKLLD
tara:strand:- start:885 stop:2120 length:1236 start_codon:yes stop_codon:yes gene_type:complete